MANILFVTWDGGGNVPPAVGIAAELQRRGDTVRFLGHQQQRHMIENAGLRFDAYSQPVPFSITAPKPGLAWIRSMSALIKDRSLGVDLEAAVRREPTDFVVIDCVLQPVLNAAEQAGIRRAVLVHSFLSIGAWSMGSNGPVAKIQGSRRPTQPWGGADLGLITTLRSLDPAGDKPLAASIRYTGPVWQGTPQPARQPRGEPTVLVSLSSCWFPGQVQVLQNVLDAVSGLPLHAIVTTGPAVSPGELKAPANAELHAYLPHADILPTVSAVIGHGGHATTMAALAHDLPVIVIPLLKIMDQSKIGRAVEQAGAGRFLPKRSSPARIRQALQQILSTPQYRIAAARLGAEIRDHDGAATAADAITNALARQTRP